MITDKFVTIINSNEEFRTRFSQFMKCMNSRLRDLGTAFYIMREGGDLRIDATTGKVVKSGGVVYPQCKRNAYGFLDWSSLTKKDSENLVSRQVRFEEQITKNVTNHILSTADNQFDGDHLVLIRVIIPSLKEAYAKSQHCFRNLTNQIKAGTLKTSVEKEQMLIRAEHRQIFLPVVAEIKQRKQSRKKIDAITSQLIGEIEEIQKLQASRPAVGILRSQVLTSVKDFQMQFHTGKVKLQSIDEILAENTNLPFKQLLNFFPDEIYFQIESIIKCA
tara:strand:+ start:1167 stop:1994 length:828 start_codon:yes stop_codon:yes gene_type:complete